MIHRENKIKKMIWIFPFFRAKTGIKGFFTKIYNFLLAISTTVEYLLLR
jgi:hypothetical protein